MENKKSKCPRDSHSNRKAVTTTYAVLKVTVRQANTEISGLQDGKKLVVYLE